MLEKLKQALVAFCKKEGVVVVIGADNKISVKPTQSIKFPLKGTPERDKLVKLLKHIHKYNEVVDLNVSMLSNVCDNWDKKDMEKIKKFQTITNDFKLSISKK